MKSGLREQLIISFWLAIIPAWLSSWLALLFLAALLTQKFYVERKRLALPLPSVDSFPAEVVTVEIPPAPAPAPVQVETIMRAVARVEAYTPPPAPPVAYIPPPPVSWPSYTPPPVPRVSFFTPPPAPRPTYTPPPEALQPWPDEWLMLMQDDSDNDDS